MSSDSSDPLSSDSELSHRMMIFNKVLSDERSFAYASAIHEINRYWLGCKECNWYKSEQIILSEVR